MPQIFKLLIIALPFLELYVLVKIASYIGVFNTIALLFLTSLIGSAILKHQGLAILRSANWRMQNGEVPANELSDGFWLAIGGALMIVPGFITDVLGVLCLIPLTRKLIIKLFFRPAQFGSYTYTKTTYEASTHKASNTTHSTKIGAVIEGEVIKDDHLQS